ncbi:MAG: NTP transferase domain-containing protein [Acidimicrobiia bacterium]|nr:NTP transferase domain-containing protein [Acidimicrobiia bacterium]
MTRVAIVPIRDFHGMTRLASVVDQPARGVMARSLAETALRAADRAGLDPIVLTGDADVRAWATTHGITVAPEIGHGLSEVVERAVTDHADWLVLHADLPLVDAEALDLLVTGASRSPISMSMAPSMDGGTNAIAGSGPFRFAFGPGSFTTHLAAIPQATVVSDRRLALEVDTPTHVDALSAIGLLGSLTA